MCALKSFVGRCPDDRDVERFRTRGSFFLPGDSLSLNFLSYCFLVKIVPQVPASPLCAATDIVLPLDFFDDGRAPSKRVDLCPDVVKKAMGEAEYKAKRGSRTPRRNWTFWAERCRESIR